MRIGVRPHVKVRIEDILLSGKDDNEHLENLDRVLKVCSEFGITLKLSKCSFFQSQVTCGYVISKEGIRAMPRNVEAVMAAPSPENVTELRAFLGKVNYYHRYLPNLVTVSEPLHRLLREGVSWEMGDG